MNRPLRLAPCAFAALPAAGCVVNQFVVRDRAGQIETDAEKVKRALSEMRAICTGMEAFAIDRNVYPGAEDGEMSIGKFRLAPVIRLEKELSSYGRFAPTDPWGHPYLYWSGGSSYALICTGSDGIIASPAALEDLLSASTSTPGNAFVKSVTTHCLEDEIVLIHGRFAQWPGDPVRSCR